MVVQRNGNTGRYTATKAWGSGSYGRRHQRPAYARQAEAWATGGNAVNGENKKHGKKRSVATTSHGIVTCVTARRWQPVSGTEYLVRSSAHRQAGNKRIQPSQRVKVNGIEQAARTVFTARCRTGAREPGTANRVNVTQASHASFNVAGSRTALANAGPGSVGRCRQNIQAVGHNANVHAVNAWRTQVNG